MTSETIEDFDLKRVRRYAIDQVGRYALQSVIPAAAVAPGRNDDEHVFSAIHDLQSDWRNRVLVLRREGWKRTKSALWLEMMNCPPVGVTTNVTRRWRCRQSLICPFCWCRDYAVELYLRARYAFYGGIGTETCDYEDEGIEGPVRMPKPPLPLDLVEVETMTKYSISLTGGFQGLLANIAKNRSVYLNTFKTLGAFQLYTLEPHDPRQTKKFWTLKHRILALVYPTSDNPPTISGKKSPKALEMPVRTMRRHHGITREILMGAVGRVCLYPAQMLRGQFSDAVAMLNFANTYRAPKSRSKQPSGFRFSGYYGLLRNKAERDAADEMHKQLGEIY